MKKPLIITICSLVILYIAFWGEVNYSQQAKTIIINESNQESISKEQLISVVVDGKSQKTFPSQDAGYTFQELTCENGSTGTWDKENWQISINFTNSDKCVISFTSSAAGLIESLVATNTSTMATDDPQGNVRYIGKSPNNYVSFNGELWRIIGVFNIDNGQGITEKRLKIVRSSTIGAYSWDTSASTINLGWGANEWSQADAMALLNSGPYWNRTSGTCYNGQSEASTSCNFTTTGLTSDAKNYISDAVWHTGTVDGTTNTYTNTNVAQFYNAERSSNTGKICTLTTGYCTDAVNRTTTWTGQVGLIYPSDYGYATGGGTTTSRATCINTALYSWNLTNVTNCKDNNWLYKTSNSSWTITPVASSQHNHIAFLLYTTGYIYNSGAGYAYDIYPTVYLSANVRIADGEGTDSNPYVLAI